MPAASFRLLPSPKQTIVFERRKGAAAVLVAINLGAKPRQIQLPRAANSAPAPLLDVFRRHPAPTDTLHVAAHKWRVLATN